MRTRLSPFTYEQALDLVANCLGEGGNMSADVLAALGIPDRDIIAAIQRNREWMAKQKAPLR